MSHPDSVRPTQSAIFKGFVRHRRFQPKAHAFNYPLFMLYLDLDELPALFAGKWYCSLNRFNLVSFKREDFFAPEQADLKQAVMDRMAPFVAGEISAVRALMHVRYLNIIFNPVVFYYCFDAEDNLLGILAEITNTPWGERHDYVLSIVQNDRSPESHPYHQVKGKEKHQFEFSKAFHVSPFNPMNMDYRWVFSVPSEKLFVHMDNFLQSTSLQLPDDESVAKHFDATLVMSRLSFQENLSKTLIQYPLMTVKVITGIYWQALKLKFKGVPFYDHPKNRLN
jgi:DUF1365 family protein